MNPFMRECEKAYFQPTHPMLLHQQSTHNTAYYQDNSVVYKWRILKLELFVYPTLYRLRYNSAFGLWTVDKIDHGLNYFIALLGLDNSLCYSICQSV